MGTHVVNEQVAPWLDLCGGWFSTLSTASDTPEIKVSLEVADLLADRTDSQYRVSWHAGGCSFDLVRFDGGQQLQPSDPVSQLHVQCDRGREVPCPTPLKELGFHCSESDDPVLYDVSNSFAEAGNRLSWTLRFDGQLAKYAHAHRAGDVLKVGDAMTTIGVNSAPLIGPGRCEQSNDDPWQCSNQVTDWIPEGRNYVVGS